MSKNKPIILNVNKNGEWLSVLAILVYEDGSNIEVATDFTIVGNASYVNYMEVYYADYGLTLIEDAKENTDTFHRYSINTEV